MRTRSAAVAFVPYLAHDVHDFEALAEVGEILFGGGIGGEDGHRGPSSLTLVTTILVAAEATWVRDQVTTAFAGPDMQVVEVRRGQDVRGAVAQHAPDLVVLDMQIANMGGIACAIDLRLEAGEGRIPPTKILLLLDREADRFLAKRADADAELVKPVDAGILRRAAKGLLAERLRPPAEPGAAAIRAGVVGPVGARPAVIVRSAQGDGGASLHSPPLRDVAQFG